MWEEDREREEELRRQEDARKDDLRAAIAAAAARRGAGNGGGGGGGGNEDDMEARFQQMEEDINRAEADAPKDPEENRRWMIERDAEIRERYADLLALTN